MAMTTETATVKIVMVDAGGSTSTFKFENPEEELTLEQVREAFAPEFSSDTAVIVSPNGEYFVAVQEAFYETILRETIE